MVRRTTYFIALLFTALALAPAMAHLLVLPNKIDLAQEEYFIAQTLYRGWALLGAVIIPALIANLVLLVLVRHQRRAFVGAAVAFFGLLAGHILFWLFTYPANRATENWTVAPADWEALRIQWEYSHAANAILTLVAFIGLVVSVLSWRRGDAKA